VIAVWRFLLRCWLSLYHRSGGYRLWSGLYRFIWERKFSDVKLPTFVSLQLLGDLLTAHADAWRADGAAQLGDACSYPGKAWMVFTGALKPESGFDCDDFAVFITNVLQKSLLQGTMKDIIANPKMLFVTWLQGAAPSGHNVCLFEWPRADGAVFYSYMDYGQPSLPRATVQEVVEDVRHAQAPGCTPLTWLTATADLRPLHISWN
jgi:hypothetical protein